MRACTHHRLPMGPLVTVGYQMLLIVFRVELGFRIDGGFRLTGQHFLGQPAAIVHQMHMHSKPSTVSLISFPILHILCGAARRPSQRGRSQSMSKL